MDELDNLVNRAEQHELETEAAQKFDSPKDEKKEVAIIAGISPEEAAANMAGSMLMVGFSVCQFLLDPRLQYDQDEEQAAREKLAPVIQKYNLAMGGTGKIPFIEEIMAGLYLGGLYKRIRRVLSELKASDKAKQEANQQANQQANKQANFNQTQANYSSNGQERKHQPQEQSHPLPSEVGLREEPNTNPNF